MPAHMTSIDLNIKSFGLQPDLFNEINNGVAEARIAAIPIRVPFNEIWCAKLKL